MFSADGQRGRTSGLLAAQTRMCSTARVPASSATAETPADQHLLTESDGKVLIVTMNRPERRNALSASMMEGMSAAWDEVNANPDIRVAILTGASGCFCAG